jgi:uncharacterized membrane protein YedE/YeeE
MNENNKSGCIVFMLAAVLIIFLVQVLVADLRFMTPRFFLYVGIAVYCLLWGIALYLLGKTKIPRLFVIVAGAVIWFLLLFFAPMIISYFTPNLFQGSTRGE